MGSDTLVSNGLGLGRVGRLDAVAKATGSARYTADVHLPGLVHAAVARSSVAHGVIRAVHVGRALAGDGVLGVFVADQLPAGLFGRRVRDSPILATGKVRHIGEPVAVVVARRRQDAERAADLVEIEVDEVPGVFDATEALEQDSPRVHEAPWAYPGAVVSEGDGVNLQSRVVHGDAARVEAALRGAAFVVEQTYETVAGHQGYLEPQACVARMTGEGVLEIWASNKAPYRMRQQLAETFDMETSSIILHPVLIGGDFGGKGTSELIPLCAALTRLVGQPVQMVHSYNEELMAASPRHPVRMRVRLGADRDGRLVALQLEAVADGGAYAGGKPIPSVGLHGMELVGTTYRIPHVHVDARIAYTNSVPKGHMRAPGSPQVTFAFESALDELAHRAGIGPEEIRRRNLLRTPEVAHNGASFVEIRAVEVLEAALAAYEPLPTPSGWASGLGIGVYDRETAPGRTSVRLREGEAGRIVLELPLPETGTGSHTVARDGLARLLGVDPDTVDVLQVSTAELPYDVGVGASRVTAELSTVLAEAARRWSQRGAERAVTAEIDGAGPLRVTSCCVQLAQVAVDPATGQVRVLQLLTALDVAEIIEPAAHRMQIEGGAVMGYGFACMEDLLLEDGQVWAGSLGEFRIPAAREVPQLRTVLVTGSRGIGALDVKAVGELANVPTGAAIANAVAAATGARLRRLPVSAEDVYRALRAPGRGGAT